MWRNGGNVPLVCRYDPHERVVGSPLPHLFQRRNGWRWEVISYPTIQKLLLGPTIACTAMVDPAGNTLKITPHDFRRIFATDAVSGGLPIHIVARLLGHA